MKFVACFERNEAVELSTLQKHMRQCSTKGRMDINASTSYRRYGKRDSTTPPEIRRCMGANPIPLLRRTQQIFKDKINFF